MPGYKAGGPITSLFNMVEHLKSDVQFSIFTRNTDWFDSEPYNVSADCWTQTHGASVYYSSQNHLRGAMKALSIDVEVLYFNGFYSPLFNAVPMMFALLFKPKLRIIVAPRGMLNRNAIAIKSTQKKLLIKFLDLLGIERKVTFHATTEKEKEAILEVYPKAHIHLVSNFISNLSTSGKMINQSRQKFLSVGRISPVKNTLSLVEMFAKRQINQLILIGTSDDQRYFESCSNIIESSPNILSIGGRNAEEIKQDYQNADFFISMTSGENFGHAIIEALSFGCPVIISDQTPWNDLEKFGAGWVMPLEDNARWEDVLKHAIALSDEDYAQMSKNAVAYVKTRFNFEEIRSNYLELFSAKS